ncbi:MAG: VCBS repeat-containing protein [Candidatus Accumulibacter meliphilus]|uniref:VCBS repeat-containing protein n=1 Tax=Candidatus Accumulibacter meliphilus TaxID=2211374 RepID=A0A369XP62_9PROT|nr:MAG: VCBS repeat-containing protein [Candidatus Accumulibacter meliphilus]
MKSGGAAATPSKPAAAHQSPRRLLAAALLALSASAAGVETITGGQYAAPVEHYGHFALGRPHEYARLTVSTSNGQRHSLELPEDAVFEDLAPRLVTLAAGEPPELLAIVSQRDSGSRLALIGLRDDRLVISAQSPPIGTPMRWLNPVGVADLDGDGQAEIAAVTTPHRSGTLRIYRRKGKRLLEVAALAGVSNHVYGSSELAMSLALTIAGQMQLLVPDSTHLRLRIIALHDGQSGVA